MISRSHIILVISLSAIVTVESVYLILRLLTPGRGFGENYITESISSSSESEGLITASNNDYGARIWLESKSDLVDTKAYIIDLWLESWRGLRAAEVQLNYDPQVVSIQDAIPESEGVQISFGDAPLYLNNQVDLIRGQIFLSARWTNPVTGKLKLGSLKLQKLSEVSTTMWWRYLPHSREGSYVELEGEILNKLAPPTPFTL